MKTHSIRKTLNLVLIAALLAGLLLTVLPAQPARAQLDVVHYIPPFYATWTPSLAARLYLSTPSTTAVNVSVDDGTGASIWSGTISNAAPTWVNVTANVLTADGQLNQVQTNGLVVTADAPIYANVRHTVSSQASSVTAKGLAALGTRFRAGVVRDATTVVAQTYRGVFIAVMATEDNTTVNFDDFKPGVVFYGTTASGAPLTTEPFAVTLDANESYVVGIRATNYAGSASFNEVNGTLITADKPIAVNTGSWLGAPGTSQDIGIDQIIPEERLALEYILMQGNGGNGIQETPVVIATVDGTQVTVNGNPTVICTLNAGDYCFLDGNYIGGNMLVQATQPVYIYQTMAGASGNDATIGMNFIPPVDTTSPSYVDNIPHVQYTGSATVNILARSGAAVSLNGTPVGVAPVAVAGNTDWVTYRLTGMTGNIAITSDEAIAVQFTNVSSGIGAAGYYSGLPLVYRDYGDLPAVYNLTLSADNGARHTTSALYLGASVDDEIDGQESADAGRAGTGGDDGADTDDENGIGVVGTWQEGVNGGTVDVLVSGENGCLSGWIDWNSDNDFGDAGEQALDMVAVGTGTNRLSFDIPAGVLPSQDFYDHFSRFRLASDSGTQGDCSDDPTLALTGLVIGGEVEDHYLRFSRPTGTGPGGVGTNDGNSSLALWLNANNIAGASNDPISAWVDVSGNGIDFSQGTASNQPTLQTSMTGNGQQVVRFDGTDDVLSGGDNLDFQRTDPHSMFLVVQDASTSGIVNIFSKMDNAAGAYRGWDYFIRNRDVPRLRNNLINTWDTNTVTVNYANVTFDTTNFHIEAFSYDGSSDAGGFSLWRDGSLETSTIMRNTLSGDTTNAVDVQIGNLVGGNSSTAFDGDLGETIVYNANINSARRLIVENYLQAKYNDSTIDNLTIATDVYDGDTTVNGNFDLNVAGIGQEADGDNWTAHSAGLIVQDVSYLQDSGDYLLFGHNVPVNDHTPNDVPDTGDWDGTDDQRWLRHWYFKRTDTGTTGGLVDIIFDFNEGEMDAASLPAGPTSNYRLLRRANPTGQFEDITSACTESISYFGDQVIFRNVDVTCLGSNFTLGTIDAENSPTALNLQSFSTNAGIPFLQGTVFLCVAFLALAGLFIWQRRRAK